MFHTDKYAALVARHREAIIAAEKYIREHPQTGFKEWQTGAASPHHL